MKSLRTQVSLICQWGRKVIECSLGGVEKGCLAQVPRTEQEACESREDGWCDCKAVLYHF